MSQPNPFGGVDAGRSGPFDRYGAPIAIAALVIVVIGGCVAIRQELVREAPPFVLPSTSVATAPPATAAPVTAPEVVGSVPSAPGTAIRVVRGPRCTFTKGVVESCQSDDPTVDLRVVFSGDSRQCTFDHSIDWGDGSPAERGPILGGPAGARRVATHTYHRAARFSLRQQVRVTAGSCRGTYEGAYTFTLDG